MTAWHLYILELCDRTLYTGITVDLERRVGEHNLGTASKCTRAKRPVKLVYSKAFPDRSSASREECRIKKMTRPQKLNLINEEKPE